MKSIRLLPMLILSIVVVNLLSACATITKKSTQSVTINTRPPGAICALVREGETISVINQTPDTISVKKDKDTIYVTCSKRGFQDSSGEVLSKFESMTFGNILFGGLIGIGVDAASGAIHEYPPIITITLIPEQFNSVADRDAFFNRMKTEFITESERVVNRIKKICSEDTCDDQIIAAEKAKVKKLEDIEAKRQEAIIVSE